MTTSRRSFFRRPSMAATGKARRYGKGSGAGALTHSEVGGRNRVRTRVGFRCRNGIPRSETIAPPLVRHFLRFLAGGIPGVAEALAVDGHRLELCRVACSAVGKQDGYA